MNTNELTKLWEHIESVMNASTKEEAKPLLSRLRLHASHIKAHINDPYLKNKLDEVIKEAEEASGRVKNKAEMRFYVQQSWYAFESGIKIQINSNQG